MHKISILNTREIKNIKEKLLEQFACFPEEEYVYLLTDKNRLFLMNKTVGEINLKNLIIDRLGLYFAEMMENGSIRLSKEGSQLLGKEAKKQKKELKNLIELSPEELKKYFLGKDLEKDLGSESKFVLLRFEEDILGCAKYKEKIILNFLPKIHRGEVIV